MAKRKKQDKIIAKLRRELQITRQELKRTKKEIAQLRGEKPKKSIVAEKAKIAFLKAKKQPPEKDEKIWEYPPALIKKDLIKTLILSGLAIIFELVLYLVKLPN